LELVTLTRRLESWKGRGRNNSAFTTEKMAVFAPIPSASVKIAMAVKPGLFASIRIPYFRSCQNVSMNLPLKIIHS
jgi:hypothetical protein